MRAFAPVEIDEPGQGPDGGGLAGTVGADQAVELAAGHREAEPVERLHRAEAAPEVVGHDGRPIRHGGALARHVSAPCRGW